MRLFFLLLLIISSLNCNPLSKVKKKKIEVKESIKLDIQKMLPPGVVTVEIRDSIGYGIYATIIRERIIDGIEKNAEWYTEYRKQYPRETIIPYHPNFGVTEEEFDYYRNNKDKFRIESTISEQLKIEYNGQKITFDAERKLQIMSEVKFDLKKDVISFSGTILSSLEEINIVDNYNIYRSPWSGYRWMFSDPESLEGMDILEMYSTPIKQYSLTLGKIEKTGLTFLDLKIVETYPNKDNIKKEIAFIIQ